MAGDHDGNAQLLTKVLNDNRCRSGPRDSVRAAHAARLINKQSHGKIDRLSRKPGIAEDTTVIPVECVLIEPFPDIQACLLPALAFITQDGADTSLKPFGEQKQLRSHAGVAVNEGLVNLSHAMHRNMDVPMCIPISDAVCLTLEFFRQFLFHRLIDAPLRHVLQ